MATKKKTTTTARPDKAGAKARKGFTDEERLAMKERAAELKAARGGARGGARGDARGGDDAERAVLAKIEEMPGTDRAIARRVHVVVKESAPTLEPRLWYGMPAYAKDGKVLCFFQAAGKFKTRYATLGFTDRASLDEGSIWPTAFALKKLAPAEEATIRKLVERAVR